MELKRIEGEFSICQVRSYRPEDLEAPFCFIGKTDEENSLVCPTAYLPKDALKSDGGWLAFRIEGVLDFALTGILAAISAVLAEHGIGIFAVSTYNTDYVLTKRETFEKALVALESAGYKIV